MEFGELAAIWMFPELSVAGVRSAAGKAIATLCGGGVGMGVDVATGLSAIAIWGWPSVGS
jgi:hypothetical protein